MMLHSTFAPSSLGTLVHCHGMRSLTIDLPPEEDTDAAREGTACHWVGEQIIAGVMPPVGNTAPNGVVIDASMIDAGQTYATDIKQITGANLFSEVTVEEPVFIPQIHAECWGTPDAWWFNVKTSTLYVWDLKYGHKSVLAEGNFQLAAYIVGILNHLFGVDKALREVGVKVVATIVQPRCYDGLGTFRRWNLRSDELRGWINRMNYACQKSEADDCNVTSGPHCTYCRAAHLCPAARESAAASIDFSYTATPQVMSPVGLDFEASMLEVALDRLKTRKTAIDAEIEARLHNNEVVPGRALKQKYGNNAWLQSDEDVFAMGDMLGVDFRAPAKVCTPAAAKRAMVEANMDPDTIVDFYGKKPTSMAVVKDDGSKAKNIFSKGEL